MQGQRNHKSKWALIRSTKVVVKWPSSLYSSAGQWLAKVRLVCQKNGPGRILIKFLLKMSISFQAHNIKVLLSRFSIWHWKKVAGLSSCFLGIWTSWSTFRWLESFLFNGRLTQKAKKNSVCSMLATHKHFFFIVYLSLSWQKWVCKKVTGRSFALFSACVCPLRKKNPFVLPPLFHDAVIIKIMIMSFSFFL